MRGAPLARTSRHSLRARNVQPMTPDAVPETDRSGVSHVRASGDYAAHMEILVWIAGISVILAVISMVIIVLDLLIGHAQHMWIMNVVWPVTALWAGPVALWPYFRHGRLSSEAAFQKAKSENQPPPAWVHGPH